LGLLLKSNPQAAIPCHTTQPAPVQGWALGGHLHPPNLHGLRQQQSRTNTMRGVPYMLGVQMVTCSAVFCHTRPTRLCNAALPLVIPCAHRTSKHHRVILPPPYGEHRLKQSHQEDIQHLVCALYIVSDTSIHTQQGAMPPHTLTGGPPQCVIFHPQRLALHHAPHTAVTAAPAHNVCATTLDRSVVRAGQVQSSPGLQGSSTTPEWLLLELLSLLVRSICCRYAARLDVSCPN
jgi:hypothetical protein